MTSAYADDTCGGIDGWGYTPLTRGTPHAGPIKGRLLVGNTGQGGNTAATGDTNCGFGTVSVGAIGAGATITLTITDSTISANNRHIFLQIVNKLPVTTAARNFSAAVRTPGAGSVVVDVFSSVAVNSGDLELWYWVLANGS